MAFASHTDFMVRKMLLSNNESEKTDVHTLRVVHIIVHA